MSEIEFRSGLVVCKHCFQVWSSLGETSTVTSTVCKWWPIWIPECRVTLSKHGVWPACCSLASMHHSFPASDTPALEKQNVLGTLGPIFQICCNSGTSLTRMLNISNNFCYFCSHHLCSSCQKRKWKSFSPSLSYWMVHGFGDSKAIKLIMPLSFLLCQSCLHSTLSSSLSPASI